MIKDKASIDSNLWASVPLSPNQITTTSLLFGILGALLVLVDIKYIIPSFILFIFAFLFDAIDGAVARAKKLVSNKGAFIDGVFDRVVDFCIILALYIITPEKTYLTNLTFLLLIFISALPSFITAYAEHKKAMSKSAVNKIPKSLGRPERSLLLLLAFLFGISNMFDYLIYAVIIVVAISLWASLVRFRFVIQN